ncbi:MAG: restriction endonuclease subunit S [Muribaculum sp.]|nr:restriction endonuclease subunit S [Muribaculum sp.]
MKETKLKDSSIPWIGLIPEHWEVLPSKFIFSNLCSGDALSKEKMKDEGFPVYGGGSKIGYTKSYNHEHCLFIGRVGSCGQVFFNDGKSWATDNALVVYTKHSLKWLYYTLTAAKLDELNTSNAQPLITATAVRNFKLPIPPFTEQERIAAWLDAKCGEIDELIDVEQQMISDLEAYRQAVITEAVTHGLNPDISTKQTSVDGIDYIPDNWKEANLLKLIYLRARLGWRGLKAEEYVEDGYPFLSAFNIINNQLRWENLNFINQIRYDESPEIKLSVNDILIVKDGAGIGKCARVDSMPLGEATVNSSLGVVTVFGKLFYSYLYYFFLSTPFQNNVSFLKNGMGVPHLTQENLKSVRIPLPPLSEQKEIATYLDAKCAEIDELIKVKQEKIETLKQYRQSIIFEAVTGKTHVAQASSL